MTTRTETKKKAPKECRKCRRWKEVKDRVRVAQLLENAITKFEDKLKAADFKPSIGDFLKLVQLEQEFEQEEAKELRVKWVSPIASNPEKST